MPSDVHTVYHFLDWRADPSEHRLSRNGEPVPITPRAMEVLAYLLERSGRVVSKEELLGAVWDGQAVTDDALVVTIYELRKALGDRARDPTYLETVVRRGYRFLPPVRASVAGTGPPPTVADPPAVVEPGHVVDPPGTPPFPQQRPDGGPRPFFRGLGAIRIAAVLLFAGAAVAVALGMAPGPKEGRRLTPVGTGVDATEAPTRRSDDRVVDALLVRARRELDERSPASLERAEAHYLRLLDLRGDDPRAHAGLARVAALRADLRLGDRFDLYHEARSRAERALSRDGSLVDAHLALATTQFILDWDASAAARSLETCLSLEPGNPDVHQVRAWLFSAMGDHAAARRAAAR
ncbi:MAG: winged helix-turn-helix domain-containing protein, partial [Acidobacteriota bacterium]